MRYALVRVLPPDVLRRRDKTDPAREEPMLDACAEALSAIRRAPAACAGTLACVRYADVPHLPERLDPEHFRARPRMAPIGRALHVLDFRSAAAMNHPTTSGSVIGKPMRDP